MNVIGDACKFTVSPIGDLILNYVGYYHLHICM